MLANVEIDLLWKHRRGRDVSAAMSLFAKVDRTGSEERGAAVAELCEFAKAGRLRASLRSLDEGERRRLREAEKAGRLRCP